MCNSGYNNFGFNEPFFGFHNGCNNGFHNFAMNPFYFNNGFGPYFGSYYYNGCQNGLNNGCFGTNANNQSVFDQEDRNFKRGL